MTTTATSNTLLRAYDARVSEETTARSLTVDRPIPPALTSLEGLG